MRLVRAQATGIHFKPVVPVVVAHSRMVNLGSIELFTASHGSLFN
jgi:hypothetical protein